MINKYGVLLLWIILPFLAAAQKTFTFSGSVQITDGPRCPFSIVFTITGDKISGQSFTLQPDGRQLSALIDGTINGKDHTFSFRESKMPLSFEDDNCMFSVELHYTMVANRYLLSGTFKGYNQQDELCDEGTVEMESSKEQGAVVFGPHREAVKKEVKKEGQRQTMAATDSSETQFLAGISAAVSKEYEWHSDSCILEIWDGEVVDGDVVTVFYNGKVVLDHYSLVATRKRLALPVLRKVNTISIQAENEGQAPPNTSMITLSAPDAQYKLIARIKTGEKAEITIRKKS